VGIKEIIGSKMFGKSRFNNTFDDFRYERQIRNRTIVWELGFKPYLKDQLVSFSALTLLVWSHDL